MRNVAQQYKYIREKIRESFKLKYALRQDERKALIKETGLHGLVLFEYYLRMASVDDIELTDEGAAEYFGWNIHTARRYRRALVNTGWFHTERATTADGKSIFLYYLGKEYVTQAKTKENTHALP